nr:hypothetical protein CKG001_10050 [Bdellovibrio sp. CKG001]
MVSKYRNEKVTYAGHKFDSRKEMRWWLIFQEQQKAGKISNLERQVKFRFEIQGKALRYVESQRAITYTADFVYVDRDGVRRVVDAKGFKTREYMMKKALMMACHGILVEEV